MFSRLATAFIYVFLTVTILAAAKPWGAPPTTTAQPPPPTTTAQPPPVTVTVTTTATGPGATVTSPASQCNTGSIQCCNSVQSASSGAVGVLAGLLGAVLGDLTALVGLNCSPLSVIGLGGNSCSAQPVCCTGNSFSGLLVLGCTPININL